MTALYSVILLLNSYGYLTDEEARKGGDFALKHRNYYQYNAGRVLISLYAHFDNKLTVGLTFGPAKEDTIIITEKEIPELGK